MNSNFNVLDNLPHIIDVDNNRGKVTFRNKNNEIETIGIKDFLNLAFKKKSGKNTSFLPTIQTHNESEIVSPDDSKKKKVLKQNQLSKMGSTLFNKSHKKIKLKLLDNNSNSNIINFNSLNNTINNIDDDKNKAINTIKNKRDSLLYQNAKNENFIKFLDLLITMEEKEPLFSYNEINIINLVKNMNNMNNKIVQNENLEYIGRKNVHLKTGNNILMNKILLLEKKFINTLNSRLKINLTGSETKLRINGKRLENLDLALLFAIYSTELEELDLSGNNIKSIEEIKYWNAPKLEQFSLKNNKIKDVAPLKSVNMPKCKKIDLSFNRINNITPLAELKKNNKELKVINIDNNRIKDSDIKAIEKDFGEIKNIIKSLHAEKRIKINCESRSEDVEEKNNIVIIYKKNNEDKIKIFDNKFVKKNKEKCKIRINGIENELIDYYQLKENESIIKVEFIINNNIFDLSYMFYECSSLSSVEEISNIETTTFTNMSYMFYGCSSLSSLKGISSLETENVTNMSYMFYGCSSLSSLDEISKWDTENVKDMSYMFYGCSSLSSLGGISNWETEEVINMNYMFYGCSLLSSLESLKNWNVN